MHLFLLLHGAHDQAVDVIPLPLQRAGHVLVHLQVSLCWYQVRGTGPAHLPPGHLLLVQPQDACRGRRECKGERGGSGRGRGGGRGRGLTVSGLVGRLAAQWAVPANQRLQSVKQDGVRQT